jgi:hypothetical protein
VDPGSFGALVPVVGDLLGDDPRDLFDALSGVSSEVVEVGRDQVEGVPTTRYRMTVDGRELSTAMAPGGPSRTWGTVGLDVWIDDDGYVRRLRSELDDPAGGTEPYAFEATVLSYDAPVEVVPPPPQDTVSVEDLLAEDGLGSLAELLGGG